LDIRKFFFRYRSFTPIPLILIALVWARPSWGSLIGGALLVFLGESLRFWGVAYAGPATRTTKKVTCARLVTEGPYAYVRNPLYIGIFGHGMGLDAMDAFCLFYFICLSIQCHCASRRGISFPKIWQSLSHISSPGASVDSAMFSL